MRFNLKGTSKMSNQYTLPGRDEPQFQNLTPFAQGYIEAMFFTETEHLDEQYRASEAFKPAPGEIGFSDLAPESLKKIVDDCAEFCRINWEALEAAYNQPGYGGAQQAGHDYWLTRNGHGAGFWDRKALECESAKHGVSLGDCLTEACKRAGEVWITMGDDGMVHL